MNSLTSLLKRLIQLLTRRGESKEDAEDLLQEAYLRVFEYSKKHEVHDMEALIAQTATNLAIDRYRHRLRYPHDENDIGWLEQRLPLLSPGRSPHEVWVVDQRLIEIRAALNELLEWTGDVFLAHRAGYTHRELAAGFGLSESAIEKRIARAVMWLMEEEEPG